MNPSDRFEDDTGAGAFIHLGRTRQLFEMATKSRRSSLSKHYLICLAVGALLLIATDCRADDQVWQQDLTEDIKIGASTSGFSSVQLHCAEDYISVQLELDEPFEGVFYTRGSFYERTEPCFTQGDGGKKVKLKIPLDSCGTQLEKNIYTNVVVLQHDSELIMPGDTAFRIECDHTTSLQNALESNELAHGISSKISLEDADPAAKPSANELRISVESDTDTVEYKPNGFTSKSSQLKDEL